MRLRQCRFDGVASAVKQQYSSPTGEHNRRQEVAAAYIHGGSITVNLYRVQREGGAYSSSRMSQRERHSSTYCPTERLVSDMHDACTVSF